MIAPQPRLLVVDDDKALAESVAAVLRTDDYQRVDVICDPNAAVAHINTNNYDLVILDIMMPGLTGFQLLDAVDRDNLDTAFIMLTGEFSIESTIEAMRRGASDYVRKPCDPDELLIRVRKVLTQQQLGQEHRRVLGENRELEKQLRHTQKVEAVGALAGGVAHDFNNILAIMTGNAELARLNIENPKAQEYLDKVRVAGERARELVNQLLTFSRQRDGDWQSIELNSLVAECVTLVRASIPSNIVIQQEKAREPYFVKGDATQIHQILINLCINASHAMEETGGNLEISLDRRTIRDNSDSELAAGSYIRLVVRDSGTGIDPEIMDRIFDPYFSTKAPGKGSGMGLAVVHGIVRNHGGAISVRSEAGVGTEFEILLPLTERVEPTELGDEDAELRSGEGRVMIVDDEVMVVEVLARITEQLGYRVEKFTRSKNALNHLRSNPDACDVLITDMTMPEISGEDLARQVHALNPALPMILCSGLTVGMNKGKLADIGVVEFLAKPISARGLGEALHRALKVGHDRRAQPRFAADTPGFVIFNDEQQGRGNLVDLSLSGLGVNLGTTGLAGETASVSLVLGDEKVDNLTARCVFQNTQARAGCTCGLAFEELSDAQLNRLKAIIKDHGVPLVA